MTPQFRATMTQTEDRLHGEPTKEPAGIGRGLSPEMLETDYAS